MLFCYIILFKLYIYYSLSKFPLCLSLGFPGFPSVCYPISLLSFRSFSDSRHIGVGILGIGGFPAPVRGVRSRTCLPVASVVGLGGWVVSPFVLEFLIISPGLCADN
jgi:hypothetical protein